MATAIRHHNAEPLLGIAAWLDEAHDIAWDCASDDKLLEALAVMPQLRNQLDALAGKIAVAAEKGVVQRDGSRKSSIWIGANTNGSPHQVRHDITTTKWLVDFGEFRTAYEAGILSRRHIDALRAADRPVTRQALLRDQEMIVGFAQRLSLAEFGQALQYWVNAADPDGVIPDEQVKKNQFNLRRRGDGSGLIDGDLDPLAFTTLWEAIEREIKKLRAHDEETGIQRTNRQLRVAALLALVSRGAQRSDGTMTSPLINVVLGLKLAEHLLAGQVDPEVEATPVYDDPDHRCELIDGTPIHPKMALALLGVAEMRRMVLAAESRKADVSVNTRSFPQWMKDYGLVRTRGQCAELGCDAPFHWLHADHIKPVAKGGQTRLDNEQPFCGPGNRAKSDTWTEPDDPDSPAA